MQKIDEKLQILVCNRPAALLGFTDEFNAHASYYLSNAFFTLMLI